jgi:UPF0755 protein
MRFRRIYNPVSFVFSFAVFLLLYLTLWSRVYRNTNEDAVIRIVKGDNLKTVASKLEAAQVIYNRYLFIAACRIFGNQEGIIPGEYKFQNGLTSLNIVKTITDVNIVHTYTITIPEGLNIRQIGRLTQRLYGLDSARFVYEASNDSLIKLLGVNAVSLEGFLYPDTYQVSFSANSNREQEIVRVMAGEFRKKITGEMYEIMQKKKLSLLEVVTMASIIEGETRNEAEKKTIAGVYYNRLKRGIKLEADPTVQYVLPGGWKRQLMYSDLKFQSPYNTYLHKGLPPGPINNPSLSSIIAALEPEDNKFLYFVAKGDGSHRYAESYEEHKKNIILYKQFLKEQEKKKEEEKKNSENNKD